MSKAIVIIVRTLTPYAMISQQQTPNIQTSLLLVNCKCINIASYLTIRCALTCLKLIDSGAIHFTGIAPSRIVATESVQTVIPKSASLQTLYKSRPFKQISEPWRFPVTPRARSGLPRLGEHNAWKPRTAMRHRLASSKSEWVWS